MNAQSSTKKHTLLSESLNCEAKDMLEELQRLLIRIWDKKEMIKESQTFIGLDDASKIKTQISIKYKLWR